MNLTVNGHNIFLILAVTFISSLILTPIMRKIAFHIGAVDMPNERRLNKVPMPTIGGFAVFFSFLIGFMLFGRSTVDLIPILIGAFILIFMGLCDDIKPISAKYQLVSQLIACAIVTIYGGITIDNFTIIGHTFIFNEPFNYFITIFLMVGIINTINLCDGLDGLSSGVSSIYFLTITIIAFLMGMTGGLDVTIAVLMLGSLLGFLVHNFPPAKQYIGDCGSNFVGYMIAITACLGFKTATFTSIIIPLLILATPFIDVAFAIIRRILKGQNPFNTPDKNHLHHQFLKMQFSTRSSVLIIYVINLAFAAVSVLYALGHTDYAFILYFGLMIIFLFIVLKTEVLFKKDKAEEKKDEDILILEKEEMKKESSKKNGKTKKNISKK